MNKIEGGMIQDSFPFPRLPPRVSVVGSWSNFVWAPGPEISVQQFRNGVRIEFWKLAGIEIMSRVSRNALLVLRRFHSVSKESDAMAIKSGDIMVLGEGGKYSQFPLQTTNLPVERDCAIELEVENQRYKGVALYEQDKFSKLLIFHPDHLDLVPNPDSTIWWRGKPFSARLIVGEHPNKNDLSLKHRTVNKIKPDSTLAPWPSILVPTFG